MSGARIAAMVIACAAGVPLSSPASAEISSATQGGFTSTNTAIVAATRWQVWEELIHPENWWTQGWSGDPMNLDLDARAGGCFCERLPVEGSWETGAVEHGRVVALFPEQMLRLSGSLGPQQSQTSNGTLTVTLADVAGGTQITWEYVSGTAASGNGAAAMDSSQAAYLGSFVRWLKQE